jgi:hypothetical protein
MISWLLSDNTNTAEHDWHKAYEESPTFTEWQWYSLWYPYGENYP